MSAKISCASPELIQYCGAQYDAIYNLALAHRRSISNALTPDEDDSDGEELAYFAAEEQEQQFDQVKAVN